MSVKNKDLREKLPYRKIIPVWKRLDEWHKIPVLGSIIIWVVTWVIWGHWGIGAFAFMLGIILSMPKTKYEGQDYIATTD
ncbi:hypothetical protein LCGC14_0302620 [marine sediment metagenome]|uniref:Uncharacterized protein n=1 Tax=marine sediment metagenome TaxID=412755 RepID=A0A0F9TPL8_9ZZZZ